MGFTLPAAAPIEGGERGERGIERGQGPGGRGWSKDAPLQGEGTKEGVTGRLSFQDGLEAGQVFLQLLLHQPVY